MYLYQPKPLSNPRKNCPTGSEFILFVDDEQMLIDVGRDFLERLGYKVATKSSSIDATEIKWPGK